MNRTILIIDDEVELCDVLRRFLQQRGYAVTTCSDGDGAILLVRQERPQLILLDIKMPGMSGADVLRSLREHRNTAKIIMLSAVKDDDVIQEMLRLGADGYLTKPFRLEQVAQLIETVLGV